MLKGFGRIKNILFFNLIKFFKDSSKYQFSKVGGSYANAYDSRTNLVSSSTSQENTINLDRSNFPENNQVNFRVDAETNKRIIPPVYHAITIKRDGITTAEVKKEGHTLEEHNFNTFQKDIKTVTPVQNNFSKNSHELIINKSNISNPNSLEKDLYLNLDKNSSFTEKTKGTIISNVNSYNFVSGNFSNSTGNNFGIQFSQSYEPLQSSSVNEPDIDRIVKKALADVGISPIQNNIDSSQNNEINLKTSKISYKTYSETNEISKIHTPIYVSQQDINKSQTSLGMFSIIRRDPLNYQLEGDKIDQNFKLAKDQPKLMNNNTYNSNLENIIKESNINSQAIQNFEYSQNTFTNTLPDQRLNIVNNVNVSDKINNIGNNIHINDTSKFLNSNHSTFNNINLKNNQELILVSNSNPKSKNKEKENQTNKINDDRISQVQKNEDQFKPYYETTQESSNNPDAGIHAQESKEFISQKEKYLSTEALKPKNKSKAYETINTKESSYKSREYISDEDLKGLVSELEKYFKKEMCAEQPNIVSKYLDKEKILIRMIPSILNAINPIYRFNILKLIIPNIYDWPNDESVFNNIVCFLPSQHQKDAAEYIKRYNKNNCCCLLF